MTIKTIVLEVCLVMSKNCSITSTKDMDSALTSIILGMTSYILGATCITLIARYWYKNK